MAAIIDYLLYAIALSICYTTSLILYRLFFSPLAKFPGPKLAAATQLYEIYYDIIKHGQFMYEIERMHHQYGPVVRINPFELHVRDPYFYDQLYAGPSKVRDKYASFVFNGETGSSFATAHHALHRTRRGSLGPFFSKKAVANIEPLIQSKVNLLCSHFTRAMDTDEAIELHTAFACFAADVVSQYSFGASLCFGYLNQPRLSDQWKKIINGIFELLIIPRLIPSAYFLSHLVPRVACMINPVFEPIPQFEKDIHNIVKHLSQQSYSAEKEMPIFQSIMQSEKLPVEERKLKRIADEAAFLVVAGTDAPSQVLAITIFHLLWNPCTYQKLQAELVAALPDLRTDPSWSAMEELPYLKAVIKEGLRLSAVVTSRLPRIAPNEVLRVQGWEIPPGTPVGMSNHFILRDPNIYHEPMQFLPERWMGSPEEVRRLGKYLVPFSKGSLGCLGPTMTYSWLNLALATILRRFELALFETTDRNVEIVRDCFNGQTVPGLNNVKVKVKHYNL
ncbi:hypothetical protein ASPWEDRAFT_733106 [Aspergillus wentii DTO 134E9]|uniref:Cytochrome P450 n=1 Tax=Aspergillus wentii DTO 134E9 TaxID=1073089 RepID=A0A1L9S414_ASPWE|nr:uncharacterized protein ASPWEDRAFT_733106 [Aspergillus wentii DTO 134E9]KAI9930243.1 hypothetical protein MW887_012055 [Aspergillus wentii]OJJ41919.1 hypothetical protein ASPWEDRAFT_733106 [Aspergillus wentii DTO 134E9]